MSTKDIIDQATAVVKDVAKTTASVQVQETPQEKPTMAEAGGVATAIGTVGGGLLAIIFWLRRKIPKDTLEIGKDRTEGLLMQTLMTERDSAVKRADAAIQQTAIDAGRIAGLVEQNKYLQEEVARLNAVVVKMEEQFDELKKSLRILTAQAQKQIGGAPPDTVL